MQETAMSHRRSKSANYAVIDETHNESILVNSEPTPTNIAPPERYCVWCCDGSYDEEDLIEEYISDDAKQTAMKAGIRFKSRYNTSYCNSCIEKENHNSNLAAIVELVDQNVHFYKYLKNISENIYALKEKNQSLNEQMSFLQPNPKSDSVNLQNKNIVFEEKMKNPHFNEQGAVQIQKNLPSQNSSSASKDIQNSTPECSYKLENNLTDQKSLTKATGGSINDSYCITSASSTKKLQCKPNYTSFLTPVICNDDTKNNDLTLKNPKSVREALKLVYHKKINRLNLKKTKHDAQSTVSSIHSQPGFGQNQNLTSTPSTNKQNPAFVSSNYISHIDLNKNTIGKVFDYDFTTNEPRRLDHNISIDNLNQNIVYRNSNKSKKSQCSQKDDSACDIFDLPLQDNDQDIKIIIKKEGFQKLCHSIPSAEPVTAEYEILQKRKTVLSDQNNIDQYDPSILSGYLSSDDDEINSIISLYSDMNENEYLDICNQQIFKTDKFLETNAHKIKTESNSATKNNDFSNHRSTISPNRIQIKNLEKGSKMSDDLQSNFRCGTKSPLSMRDPPYIAIQKNNYITTGDINLDTQNLDSKNCRKSAVDRILNALNNGKNTALANNQNLKVPDSSLSGNILQQPNKVNGLEPKRDIVQLVISPQIDSYCNAKKGPSLLVNVDSNLANQCLQDTDPNFQISKNLERIDEISRNLASVKNEMINNLDSKSMISVKDLVDELDDLILSHKSRSIKSISSNISEPEDSNVLILNGEKTNHDLSVISHSKILNSSIHSSSLNTHNAIPIIDQCTGNTKFVKRKFLPKVVKEDLHESSNQICKNSSQYDTKEVISNQLSHSVPQSLIGIRQKTGREFCETSHLKILLTKKESENLDLKVETPSSIETAESAPDIQFRKIYDILSPNTKSESTKSVHSIQKQSLFRSNDLVPEQKSTHFNSDIADFQEPSNMLTRRKLEMLTLQEKNNSKTTKEDKLNIENSKIIQTLELVPENSDWIDASSDNTIIDKKKLIKLLEKPTTGLKINKYNFSNATLTDLNKGNPEPDAQKTEPKPVDKLPIVTSFEAKKNSRSLNSLRKKSDPEKSKFIQEILREAQVRLDTLNNIEVGTGPRPIKRIQKYVFETIPPRLLSIDNAVDLRELFRDNLYGKIQKKSRNGFWRTSWFQLRGNSLICYNSRRQRLKNEDAGHGAFIDYMIDPEETELLLCPKYSLVLQGAKVSLQGVMDSEAGRSWGLFKKLKSNFFNCQMNDGFDLMNFTIINAQKSNDIYEVTIKDNVTKELKKVLLRELEVSLVSSTNSKMHLRFLSPREFLKWMVIFDLRTGKIPCPMDNIIITSK